MSDKIKICDSKFLPNEHETKVEDMAARCMELEMLARDLVDVLRKSVNYTQTGGVEDSEWLGKAALLLNKGEDILR